MKLLFTVICSFLLHSHQSLACTDTGGTVTARMATRDWWQVAQFYQIYPRSFKDSNGDGIGDLKGIISKLDYLKEIGVTAAWLSPIFKSPMVDFGYDIADFFDIQDEYGTLNDFDELIKEAKKRDLKIILDFVPNHSSNESVWFKKSVAREKGYEDYYVWHDGYIDENGKRTPPSNWLQAFRGSAWEWNEVRKQYYLHQFAVQQPDLNYRNPAVVAQMKRVLKFWLDRGIAGFRIDAVPWLFEVNPDESGRYPDEPKSGYTDDPDDSSYLKHIYTQDQPETVDMVYQWHQLLEDYQRIHGGDTRVLMIETWSEINIVMQFYGNKTTQGAQIPFNFQFMTGGYPDKNNTNLNAKGFIKIIESWFKNMPAGKTANWVMGNHDNRRVGSRYGEKRIDTMNMLQMFLPGVSVTYMGEEIGMVDLDISWTDTRDPSACNSNPQIYESFTRDPARTPFQWDGTTSAGFSTSSTTWLPVNPNFSTINVETERVQAKSHLNVYKQMMELRKTKTLQYGDVLFAAPNDNVVAIKRSLPNENTYIMLANVMGVETTSNLTQLLHVTGSFKVKVPSTISARKEGDVITTDNFLLQPYETIIVESN